MNICLHLSIVEIHMCDIVSTEDILISNIPTIER
jgi:hypothetical protein